jgi:Ankyrin repeats (3 copies)
MSTISDCKLYSLPGEILVHTINQMDFVDVFKMFSVSKYIKECADSHQLYLNLCHKMGFKSCNHVNNSVESVKHLYTLIKKIQTHVSFSELLWKRFEDWESIQENLEKPRNNANRPSADSIRKIFKKYCIDTFLHCYSKHEHFPSHPIDQWILLVSLPPSYRSDILGELILPGEVDLALELLENGFILQTPFPELTGHSPFACMHRENFSEEQHKKYDYLIDLLLKAGANPNYTDRFGRTPLHHSAEEYDIELTKKLLAAGADPNSRENCFGVKNSGDAPIHKLSSYWRSNCLPLMKLLVENKANINLTGANNKTILEIITPPPTAFHKNPELIAYLKEQSKI